MSSRSDPGTMLRVPTAKIVNEAGFRTNGVGKQKSKRRVFSVNSGHRGEDTESFLYLG